MTVSTKKKSIYLVGLVLVLIAAAIFWVARSTGLQRPLAAIPLGDGRILQIEAVTYGVNHHVGNARSDNLLWRLTAWTHLRIARANRSATINGLQIPSLVVWVNAVSAATRKNVDCQGITMEVVNEHGERFGTSNAEWFGGQGFWREGHVFEVYPRDESNLTIRVTTWRNKQSSLMKIPNPHVVRPTAWTGADLPQQATAGDLTIRLGSLQLRTNNPSPRYFETRTVYWEPAWELLHGTEKVVGWTEPEWQAEDPLGNRGQFLGTNQPFLRFSATFYPTATNTAAQLLTTMPKSPVTNQQSVVWWNQTARHGSNDVLVLGLFPKGTRVFEGSNLLTNPPIPMGPVSGGARSGWTGATSAANPMKVVHYSSHYSTLDSVIYVSAPNFPAASLAMRLRDDQGRNWEAKPDGSENGIFPFLVELPSDVVQVTPELVLLTPVNASFTVKVPGISSAANNPTPR
jgi:hypothetical protein